MHSSVNICHWKYTSILDSRFEQYIVPDKINKPMTPFHPHLNRVASISALHHSLKHQGLFKYYVIIRQEKEPGICFFFSDRGREGHDTSYASNKLWSTTTASAGKETVLLRTRNFLSLCGFLFLHFNWRLVKLGLSSFNVQCNK